MSISITINGTVYDVEPGIMILEAARRNNIYIPTLCDYPGLPSRGSCRMCVVDIQGKPNTPTACTTPVDAGMVIQTNNPKVQALRSELLQMLLAEHPSGCLFCPEKDRCQDCMVTLRKAAETTGCRSCPADTQCELQVMVNESALSRVGYLGRYRMLKAEKYDPFYDRDYNLCILCGRCIRICEDLHFSSTLTFVHRGSEALVGTAFHRTHLDAGCSFCGACVEACPTGSLMEKTRKWDGKPDASVASTCPFCSIGCEIEVLAKNGEVIGSLPDRAAGRTNLCVKGRFGVTELVNQVARLKLPQKREGHEYHSAQWEDVYQLAVEKITACAPERFELLISSSCGREDLFVAQKFAREVVKSPHIYTSAQTRYGVGAALVGGLMRKSQPLELLKRASAVLCLGFDGRYAQSVVEVELHKAMERGARILSVNAKKHALSRFADVWLQPEAGKESELIAGLVKLIAEMKVSQPDSSVQPAHIVEKMALELYRASGLVVVLGPDFLTSQDNEALLVAVEKLLEITGAAVMALPEQGNLYGALQMGIFRPEVHAQRDVDVLYLIGEDVPAQMEGDPFVLYHNICQPTAGRTPALLLPGEAFTEADSSLVDYTGTVRMVSKAVQAPGKALAGWKVLSEIARRMGAQGFEYACVEDIRAEMGDELVVSAAGAGSAEGDGSAWAPGQITEHTYMGFPLSKVVEGLQLLYPEETVR